MIKFVKRMFSRKSKLQQQYDICNYLDQLQLSVLKGVK